LEHFQIIYSLYVLLIILTLCRGFSFPDMPGYLILSSSTFGHFFPSVTFYRPSTCILTPYCNINVQNTLIYSHFTLRELAEKYLTLNLYPLSYQWVAFHCGDFLLGISLLKFYDVVTKKCNSFSMFDCYVFIKIQSLENITKFQI